MFEGVEAGGDEQSRRRVAVSTGAALIVYGGLGAIALAVGGRVALVATQEPEIKVVFHAPPALPEPEAPAPAPAPAPKPALGEEKPPEAPVVIPADDLVEGHEDDFRATATVESVADIASALIGDGDGAVGWTPPPPPPTLRRINPAFLPDDAIAPVPLPGNPEPRWPKEARRLGREGLVVLRVLVGIDGRVSQVTQVVAGEEPFLAAAREVATRWRFEPGRVDGRPAEMLFELRFPFRLKSS